MEEGDSDDNEESLAMDSLVKPSMKLLALALSMVLFFIDFTIDYHCAAWLSNWLTLRITLSCLSHPIYPIGMRIFFSRR
ncbi:hypothetical protein [Streptococcus merionis]